MARELILNGQRVTLPAGVEIRGGSVRIGFGYKGRRYYETLYREATPETVRKAGIKRAAIVLEIESDGFDYRRHFPDSKHALKLAGFAATRPGVSVEEMLEEEAQLASERKAPSTLKAEIPRHRHILGFFGPSQQVRSITIEDAERFKRDLKRRHSAKTVNNTLVVLRSILKRAFHRGILERSLHDRFENLPADETKPQQEVQPLTLSEMDAFAGIHTLREGDRDMFILNCWVGLSVSELMGLAWDDVDTGGDVWRISVRRARVDWIWKVPKEKSRRRTIELNAKAKNYLSAQRQRTLLLPSMTVDVLQRDNMTVTPETIKPVFRNGRSGEAWNKVSLDRMFRSFCRRAEIPVRGPNQCRHTFASRMLTAGLPPHVLAHLMGHTSEAMIRRHYAKWLDDDMDGRVAGMMDAAIRGLV